MISKTSEKQKAILLRKSGKTYSEILNEVNVAKSSLSLWLREVGLSKKQKHTITEKKIQAARKGGLVRKTKRIEFSESIFEKSIKEIGKISERELWLIGVALYWAEGSKEKENKPGSGLDFTNSDPRMVFLFVAWLERVLKVSRERMLFTIYIHENYINDMDRVKKHWAKFLNISDTNIFKIYYKKHNIKTNRKNIGNVYNGNLRIKVRESSTFLRQISGWVMGICKN